LANGGTANLECSTLKGRSRWLRDKRQHIRCGQSCLRDWPVVGYFQSSSDLARDSCCGNWLFRSRVGVARSCFSIRIQGTHEGTLSDTPFFLY
jgi:hypothetical protein